MNQSLLTGVQKRWCFGNIPCLLKFIWVLVVLVDCAGCNLFAAPVKSGIVKFDYLNPHALYESPIWSPDGLSIAVTTKIIPPSSWISIFDTRTGKRRTWLEVDYGWITPEDWSPDGDSILVHMDLTKIYQDGIWLFDLAQKNPIFISDGNSATFSPDGNQVAVFTCGEETRIDIIDLPTLESKNIFHIKKECGKGYDIKWSPDGNWLVFQYDRTRTYPIETLRIYVLDISSGQYRQLVDYESSDPAWSTDGKIIGFIDQEYQVVLTDLAGCEEKISIPGIPSVFQIAWAPDNSHWAIINGDLFIVDISKVLGEGYLADGLQCQRKDTSP